MFEYNKQMRDVAINKARKALEKYGENKSWICTPDFPSIASGTEFKFVKINNDIGIKFSKDGTNVSKTYNRQFKLAQLGLAPPVYDIFSFAFGKSTFYAYITALADDVGKLKSYEIGLLEADLREAGYESYVWDLGSPNTGRYNGKLVIIDLGELSTSYETPTSPKKTNNW